MSLKKLKKIGGNKYYIYPFQTGLQRLKDNMQGSFTLEVKTTKIRVYKIMNEIFFEEINGKKIDSKILNFFRIKIRRILNG